MALRRFCLLTVVIQLKRSFRMEIPWVDSGRLALKLQRSSGEQAPDTAARLRRKPLRGPFGSCSGSRSLEQARRCISNDQDLTWEKYLIRSGR
jgi:hypothetical protein